MAWTQKSPFIIKRFLYKEDNDFHFVSMACFNYTLIIEKMMMLVGIVRKIIFIFVDLVVLSFYTIFKEQMNQFERTVFGSIQIQWYLVLKIPAEFLVPA